MVWNRIIFLSVVASLGVISASLCAPALPFIADHFSAHFSMIQFTISLFLVGNAFGQLISGPLSDQMGQKNVLLMGLMLYVIASLGCATSSQMALLLIFRFFQGMGSSVGPVLSRAIAASLFPQERSAQIQSYGAMGIGIASMLSILCSGYLTLVSWRSNFILATVMGVALLTWTYFSLQDISIVAKESISFRGIFSRMKQVFKNSQFLANASCHTMTYGLMYGYISLFPFLLMEVFHEKNPAQVGIYSAYMIGFYMIGTFIAARLVIRWTSKRLVGIGILLQCLAGLWLLTGLTSFWLMMALALFNISIGMILPITAANALSPFAGTAVGAASSTLGLSYRFVGSLMSTLICCLPLTGGKNLGLAMVFFSLLSFLWLKRVSTAPITASFDAEEIER